MTETPNPDPEAWQSSLADPFREELLHAGDAMPDRIVQGVERLRGEPAFDPERMDRLAGKISLPAGVRFPHPLLERVVRIGLAHIDATFDGDHPKYGVGSYAREEHDGFPPTIIAAVDALTLWGHIERAETLFSYWLHRFVRDDGTIRYYGPSLSEYGQLLTTGLRLMTRGGSGEWLQTNGDALSRIARFSLDVLTASGDVGLLEGVPEADTVDDTATYYHNNAWIVRGLRDWAFLPERSGDQSLAVTQVRTAADDLHRLLLQSVESVWPKGPADRWLTPIAEGKTEGNFAPPRSRVTETYFGSYANYRYWPELLSSGVLPEPWMERIVEARLNFGGQFCGTTRFLGHLDDWPLMDYLEGLWQLGRRQDYMLSLWGHIFCHQAEGHLTAYEQVSFPPGEKRADYCLPCQLVAVRAVRRLL